MKRQLLLATLLVAGNLSAAQADPGRLSDNDRLILDAVTSEDPNERNTLFSLDKSEHKNVLTMLLVRLKPNEFKVLDKYDNQAIFRACFKTPFEHARDKQNRALAEYFLGRNLIPSTQAEVSALQNLMTS